MLPSIGRSIKPSVANRTVRIWNCANKVLDVRTTAPGRWKSVSTTFTHEGQNNATSTSAHISPRRHHPSTRMRSRSASTGVSRPVQSSLGASGEISGGSGKVETVMTTTQPKLVNVPSLPWIGSLIPQHSGLSKYELDNSYDFWTSNRMKFGDFYAAGFPGTGVGLLCKVYILTDPNEFMKVLRKESIHPFGAIQTEWPFIKYFDDIKSPMAKFFGRGEYWQKLRRFMQKDLLSPDAARGYVPGIVEAAQLSSRCIPNYSSNINTFMSRSSFDLFSTVIFGEATGVVEAISARESDMHSESAEFCDATVAAMERIFPLMTKPYLRLALNLGIKSSDYRVMEEKLNIVRDIAFSKYNMFRKKKLEGGLNDSEKASYCALALDRHNAEGGKEISSEEVAEIMVMALFAAVDTTSAMLNWSIVHLAMNPSVQQKLYEEVSRNTRSSQDGILCERILTKSAAPYLHAFLRENHRITPPVTISLAKDNAADDVDIHGVQIPKGNMFILDARSLGMDPAYVPNPDTFCPERWLEDAVESRKGRTSELLDHPLYRDPFSAGARKCPGSRVANYEALVMISQLVLDWKISFVDSNAYKSWRDIKYFQGLTVQPTVPKLELERRFD